MRTDWVLNGSEIVTSDGKELICTLSESDDGINEQEADLILNAPLTLKALERAKDGLLAAFPHADKIRDVLVPIINEVEAQILKAKGAAPCQP